MIARWVMLFTLACPTTASCDVLAQWTPVALDESGNTLPDPQTLTFEVAVFTLDQEGRPIEIWREVTPRPQALIPEERVEYSATSENPIVTKILETDRPYVVRVWQVYRGIKSTKMAAATLDEYIPPIMPAIIPPAAPKDVRLAIVPKGIDP